MDIKILLIGALCIIYEPLVRDNCCVVGAQTLVISFDHRGSVLDEELSVDYRRPTTKSRYVRMIFKILLNPNFVSSNLLQKRRERHRFPWPLQFNDYKFPSSPAERDIQPGPLHFLWHSLFKILR